jgi:hypothetical protein
MGAAAEASAWSSPEEVQKMPPHRRERTDMGSSPAPRPVQCEGGVNEPLVDAVSLPGR